MSHDGSTTPPSRYAVRRDAGRIAMTVEFNRRTYDRLGAVADAEEMSKAAVVRQAVRDLCDRKEAAEARRKTRESDTGVVESGTDTTTSRGGAQDDAPEDR